MADLASAGRSSAQESIHANLKEQLGQVGRQLARWTALFLMVAVLVTWEVAVRTGHLSALFFPAPSTIFQTLVTLTRSGKLGADLAATLSRLGLGLALGSGIGLVLGLVIGWSPQLRRFIDPLIAAIHPIPKISILPLVMIVLGIGEVSKIALIAIAAFFPMLINTMTGVRQINTIHFEVARNYGAGTRQVFTRVVLPGSLPLVLVGARLSFNMALMLTIAVELLTAQEGLGATIWLAWQTLHTENLYVALLVTALLGIGLNRFLQYLSVALIPYQEG